MGQDRKEVQEGFLGVMWSQETHKNNKFNKTLYEFI